MKINDFCKICIKVHPDLLVGKKKKTCKYLFLDTIEDCFVDYESINLKQKDKVESNCPYAFEKEMFQLNKGELKK